MGGLPTCPSPGDGMAKRSARSKVSTLYTLHAVEYSARVSGLQVVCGLVLLRSGSGSEGLSFVRVKGTFIGLVLRSGSVGQRVLSFVRVKGLYMISHRRDRGPMQARRR